MSCLCACCCITRVPPQLAMRCALFSVDGGLGLLGWLNSTFRLFVRPAEPPSDPVQRLGPAAPPTPRPTRNPRAMPGGIPVPVQPVCGGDTGARYPPISASSINRKQPKQPTAVVLTAKHRKTIVRCFGALLPPASLAAIRLGGAGRRGAARSGT